MAYTRPDYNAVNASWLGESTTYTRPDYNADVATWKTTVEVYSAIGIGTINIAGASLVTIGGITEVYSTVGVGLIEIIGNSLVITEAYSTDGVGTIIVSGQSFIEVEFSVNGIGSISVVGASEIRLPFNTYGIGQINVIGNSEIKLPLTIIGVGSIDVIGNGIAVRGIADIKSNWLSTHYHCYVGGTTELEVKIKSVQIRYFNGTLFISAVIPAATEYLSELLNRIDQDLKIVKRYNYADDTYSDFVIAISTLKTVRVDQGGNSGETITLSANSTFTAGNSNQISLSNPTYRTQTNAGSRRYRCEMDPRVRIGDIVTINDDSFAVASIVHYIEPFNTLTEIAE